MSNNRQGKFSCTVLLKQQGNSKYFTHTIFFFSQFPKTQGGSNDKRYLIYSKNKNKNRKSATHSKEATYLPFNNTDKS